MWVKHDRLFFDYSPAAGDLKIWLFIVFIPLATIDIKNIWGDENLWTTSYFLEMNNRLSMFISYFSEGVGEN